MRVKPMISTVVRRGMSEEADSLQASEQEGRHQRSLQEVTPRTLVRVRHQIVRSHVDIVIVIVPAPAGLLCVVSLSLPHLNFALASSGFLQLPPSDSSPGRTAICRRFRIVHIRRYRRRRRRRRRQRRRGPFAVTLL